MSATVPPLVRVVQDAQSVAAVLGGSMIYYAADGNSALVLQDDVDAQGGAYIVSIYDNGDGYPPGTVSTTTGEWSTGWDA